MVTPTLRVDELRQRAVAGDGRTWYHFCRGTIRGVHEVLVDRACEGERFLDSETVEGGGGVAAGAFGEVVEVD